MAVEQPFDYFQQIIDDEVRVQFHTRCDNNPVGTLLAFDSHNNLVIETENGTQYIRGSNLEMVKPVQSKSLFDL